MFDRSDRSDKSESITVSSSSPHSLDDADLALALENVSVRYRMPTEPVRTLKEQVIRQLQGKRAEYRELWALRDVSLEVKKGELIGLIGRNGAGKSTLLKVISRVLMPTAGRLVVQGTVAAIIELGTGFHSELTGRENIFINGAMLGHSPKTMKQKFEQIVAFAELEAYIDSPVRTYSTGMIARLGFAIAIDVDPDILIIDEVLSVGDEAFQRKCIQRMADIRERGTTIIYVTHAVDDLRRFCTRAALIDQGRLQCVGPVADVIDAYRAGLS